MSVVSPASRAGSSVVSLLCGAIEIYRALLSPFFAGSCRFEPSCSRYAEIALRRHGARRGVGLALRRLLRCQPFAGGGYDPVP